MEQPIRTTVICKVFSHGQSTRLYSHSKLKSNQPSQRCVTNDSFYIYFLFRSLSFIYFSLYMIDIYHLFLSLFPSVFLQMDDKILLVLKGSFPRLTNRNILTFSFLLLVETALCKEHWHFDGCNPGNCGNGLNISYPFWIQDKQDSFCGVPGFQLSCKNDSPILKMSPNSYVIRNISYEDQSLRVVDAGALDDTCPPLIRNVTLDRTPFSYGPSQAKLFLFFNCSTSLVHEYKPYCAPNNNTHPTLAVFNNETLLNYMSTEGNCETSIAAPVDKDGTQEESNLGLLKEGFVLTWNATNCSFCRDSGGSCGYNWTTHNFICFCPDRPHLRRCQNRSKSKLFSKIAIAVLILGFFTIVGTLLLLCYLRKKYSTGNARGIWKRRTNNAQNMEAFLRSYGSLVPKRFKYSDIKKMTNSFKDKLGQGGYGGVFKGKLLDGTMIAVKVLEESKGNGEEFINEVASISRTSHVNIVRLLGFCFEMPKRALIYEFMPNGSLEKFIHGKEPLKAHPHLGWERLYQIAIGIGRGLEYLHRGCNTRILHFDIKPHNILLDHDFCPKISDFGLTKLCLRKESIISMTGARGTTGYIAPEVFSRNFGVVSHKSDVYSYGMMVLEMVGGRKNIDVGVDHSSEIYFPPWIYKRVGLDEDMGLDGIMTEKDEQIAKKLILVGLWCIQTDPSNRPSMSKVVEMLEGRLESLQIPPKPFISSPPRPSTDSPTESIC